MEKQHDGVVELGRDRGGVVYGSLGTWGFGIWLLDFLKGKGGMEKREVERGVRGCVEVSRGGREGVRFL